MTVVERRKLGRVDGRLSDVRRQWVQLLSGDGSTIGLASDAAIGLILGVGPAIRGQLIEGWVRLNFIPPTKPGGDWVITALHGEGTPSAMATYESLYLLAAEDLAVNQRPGELITDQSLLAELWRTFSPNQQDALKAKGFDPGLLARNDSALN